MSPSALWHFYLQIREELDEVQHAHEDLEFLLLEQECKEWQMHEDSLGTHMLEPSAQELKASGAEHWVNQTG